jgi:hypothetical protein
MEMTSTGNRGGRAAPTESRAQCAAPHWSAAYVGLPYVRGEFDCAALVERVLREVFGREIHLPKERAADVLGLSGQIAAHRAEFARRIDAPGEGDGVLMVGRGRVNHIGIWCFIDESYVLHNMRNAGQVCLHRVRDLSRYGLFVEGYYRWI